MGFILDGICARLVQHKKKSIIIIHHIDRLKMKNHTIIPIDEKKSMWQNQTLMLYKIILSELGIQKNFLHLIRRPTKILQLTHVNGEKLKAFTSEIRNQEKTFHPRLVWQVFSFTFCRWMNKRTVVHPENGMLFRDKEKWTQTMKRHRGNLNAYY